MSRFVIILITLSFIGVGCRKPLKPGHYEGVLYYLHDFQNVYLSQPVSLEVSVIDTKATVNVISKKKSSLLSIELTKPKSHQIGFYSPRIKSDLQILERVRYTKNEEEYRCYVKHSDIKIEICYNDFDFSLKVTTANNKDLLKLSGNPFKVEEPLEIDSPMRITVSKAIDLALAKNFDLQLGFQQYLQAKNIALTAWLNLLPHFNIGMIWSGLPSFTSYLSAVTALTPFLIPANWLRAKRATIDTKIKRDAFRIMQADVAITVEQLAYAYVRDKAISSVYQSVLNDLDFYETRVMFQGGDSQVLDIQVRSLDLLRAMVSTIKGGVDRVLTEDGFALAECLGIQNPNGIEDITLGEELVTLESADPVDKFELAVWASERSFELQQLDFLIEAADLKNIELYMIWIDPSGDSSASLGFNLIGQQRVANTEMASLKIKRKQLKNLIHFNAHRVALQFNETLEHRKAKLIFAIDQPPYQSLLEKGFQEKNFDLEKLKLAILSYLLTEVEKESNGAAFRIARSKRDRLLLSGTYQKLLPELPVQEPAERERNSQVSLNNIFSASSGDILP